VTEEGSCDHFQPEMGFWAVQAGSIPKKNLKLKYATFEGGFFMFS